MKERPVLFSAPMVRALLDGAKTQTRRLVEPMRGLQSTWLTRELIDKSPRLTLTSDGSGFGAQMEHPRGGPGTWIRCPFGAPGDRLWVRETWWHGPQPDRAEYDADFDEDAVEAATFYGAKRRPGIRMPRWASRITLEITDVHVERLQDISDGDARAEGIDRDDFITPRAEFAELWDSLNANAPWASNPWAWVIGLRLIAPTRGER